MCSIIASFDKKRFLELRDKNLYRGALTHSLGNFVVGISEQSDAYVSIIHQQEYPIVESDMIDATSAYYIGHTQAPTSQSSNIHPAFYKGTLLWHNGIVKNYNGWDTQMICEVIYGGNWEALSDIDGSFACVYFARPHAYVFRNEIAPLFYSEKLDFSSTKFDGGIQIPPNQVWKLNFKAKRLVGVGKFTTKNNPYEF